MNKIQDGVYNALPDAAAVYEKNGKLVLECRFSLCDENGNPFDCAKQSKVNYLTSKDGAVNSKCIEFIRKWAPGWDGVDPYWFSDNDSANFIAVGMVSVTLSTKPYTKNDGTTAMWQDIEWVNALGQGGGSKPLENADKASIMAKYGAKFRAAAGALPVSTANAPKAVPAGGAAPKAAVPARPPVKAPVPAPNKQKSGYDFPGGQDGMNAVWEKYTDQLPEGTKDAERDEKWFAAVDKFSGGKDQCDMTGEEWGKVAAELGVMRF